MLQPARREIDCDAGCETNEHSTAFSSLASDVSGALLRVSLIRVHGSCLQAIMDPHYYLVTAATDCEPTYEAVHVVVVGVIVGRCDCAATLGCLRQKLSHWC